ncbi:LysE family translocator [Devosia sediminis]|uniref:LysE family translocator n=1 Tax=Devosia sediminis TaxID=2798801 RepID=A0A934IXP0_9HYPH|nr:LysE family translocator [Devosia sediminis]MBJ3784182.1 LysE family translocator [Devosia sediminis]
MDYTQALWLYTVLVFGIVVVPGMDMFFVLANTLTGGRRMGMAALAGVMLGGAVHSLVGTLAVGVLTQLPTLLVQSMMITGAAYMAWIGYTLVRSTITVDGIGLATTRTEAAAFRQGLITCLLNPKAYMFVLAVFPQFVRPEFGPAWTQALALGAITVLTQGAVYGGLALAAGRGRDALVDHPSATIWISRGAGALFLLAAAVTAWHTLATPAT